MGFKIVVDSCCELNSQMMQSGDFIRVPLTISSGGSTFVDDQTLDQADLLWSMHHSEAAPSTSCPSPQAYLDAFRSAEGDIYVVTMSALLSGSHNSAVQAMRLLEEEEPDRNIHVFNSCTAASGESLVALKLRDLASSGMPFKHVVRDTEAFIKREQTLFVLESLENLRKNGRLTRLQAVVTGALKIKLLCGGTPEGEICKLGQALSMKQALTKLVSRIANDPDHKDRRCAICHCNCLDRAFATKKMIEDCCRFGEIVILEATGITTVYANQGGIVVAY